MQFTKIEVFHPAGYVVALFPDASAGVADIGLQSWRDLAGIRLTVMLSALAVCVPLQAAVGAGGVLLDAKTVNWLTKGPIKQINLDCMRPDTPGSPSSAPPAPDSHSAPLSPPPCKQDQLSFSHYVEYVQWANLDILP